MAPRLVSFCAAINESFAVFITVYILFFGIEDVVCALYLGVEGLGEVIGSTEGDGVLGVF